MTPDELTRTLDQMVKDGIKDSVMIWGPPGIGKSTVVAKVAQDNDMGLSDLRISQLAPTDLRGLPVADKENEQAVWYPPKFLPREGRGILFLDEINMAPPAVMGIAQQLVLDRKVGEYVVPEGWFIWAAGNRKQDRAAVYEMPAPVANRFLHLEVDVDEASFRAYATASGIAEQIIAFLSFRPPLIHRMDQSSHAWPSPRTWFMANRLFRAGLPIYPAVGKATADEFSSFLLIYKNPDMPDIEAVLEGRGDSIAFPGGADPSIRYATVTALYTRLGKEPKVFVPRTMNAMKWLAQKGTPEWMQVFVTQMLVTAEQTRSKGLVITEINKDPVLKPVVMDAIRAAIGQGGG
ncbi:MAG: MoxR family ATPase [Rhodanobacteraceae bacterium]|nr:MoxR family ATPase [Rhodanobacteraceae bacterium]